MYLECVLLVQGIPVDKFNGVEKWNKHNETLSYNLEVHVSYKEKQGLFNT